MTNDKLILIERNSNLNETNSRKNGNFPKLNSVVQKSLRDKVAKMKTFAFTQFFVITVLMTLQFDNVLSIEHEENGIPTTTEDKACLLCMTTTATTATTPICEDGKVWVRARMKCMTPKKPRKP
jgi:hypothetical protein